MSRAPRDRFRCSDAGPRFICPALGSLEIKGEEGRRILPAVTMLETGNWLVPQVGSEPYFRKPPLVNWLVALSFKITGHRNEWTARLPSALAVLAVALAFVSVARASLGANGSLIAALIWMVNFGMIEKGRLIEIEALYVSLLRPWPGLLAELVASTAISVAHLDCAVGFPGARSARERTGAFAFLLCGRCGCSLSSRGSCGSSGIRRISSGL